MLTKISKIKNLAVFTDFEWDKTVRDKGNNIATFKKLNIIYGRNYSGKTTISRIFRSLETKTKHERHQPASYEITHTSPGLINDSNLANCPYTVRVYNRDFIEENLKWLTNNDGVINPFAILGEKNVEIENKIEEIEERLGSTTTKQGLYWDHHKKIADQRNSEDKLKLKQKDLDEKLRTKASTDIKQNPLYKKINYNISSIKSDISNISITDAKKLDIQTTQELTLLLSEEARDQIQEKIVFDQKLLPLRAATRDLISREIRPTHTLQHLLDDPTIEEWVRIGLSHHENKDDCQFCGSSLTENIWKKLHNHFNKESEDLRSLLDRLIQGIEAEKQKISSINIPDKINLYAHLQNRYQHLQEQLRNDIDLYIEDLDELTSYLTTRKDNIYQAIQLPQTTREHSITARLIEIEDIIKTHNNKIFTLESEQDDARKKLRLSEVIKFLEDIDYEKRIKEIEYLSDSLQTSKALLNQIENSISKSISEISDLRNQLKDESKGADRVNHYLRNHFSHSTLQLLALEASDSKSTTFHVIRNGEPAYNLSEGECSLLAFCYFIAKLEDINTLGRDPIIWIDDPISSLDSNHIYFVFSLIESTLTKPINNPTTSTVSYRYNQLFISTHNLDFLKYLKRLSKPAKDNQYFILERHHNSSQIKLMPSYLRKFVTEFNYLFSQIHKCATISLADNDNHETIYNFGNNLRKFLEAYLYYKYPNNKSNDEKLLLFFGGDTLHTDITNRINNELSHLEEIFDRSTNPIEIPEIPNLAKFVLETIKRKDPDQYSALMESTQDID
ncbi:AAA family ATPase [Pseudomonas subflava]|uniref:AAA family ATPase n=1 Tax=Pseudomonas subflava TaxID=2952933 RepID=UPI00207938A2|nr:AAA family ATPase [Pseudomonas subflava]